MDEERKEDQEMGKYDRNKDKEENNQGIIQGTTQRVRLESYVNIGDDDIPIEKTQAKEGTPRTKDDNSNISVIAVNIKRD